MAPNRPPKLYGHDEAAPDLGSAQPWTPGWHSAEEGERDRVITGLMQENDILRQRLDHRDRRDAIRRYAFVMLSAIVGGMVGGLVTFLMLISYN